MANLIALGLIVIVLTSLLFWLLWHALEKWRWFQKVSWYKWCLLFLAVNVIDIHSTFVGILHEGGREANPIIVYLFSKIGIWWTFLFHKGGIVALMFAVGLYFSRRSDQKLLELYNLLLFFASSTLLLVSLWNYSIAIFPR